MTTFLNLVKGKDPKKTPAKPSERRAGSKKNKPGSAATASGKISMGAAVIAALKNKVAEHNKKYPKKKVTLGQLKAVYRRGSGAFSTSHHPKATRASWSMGRVNSFLKRRAGKGGHTQDDDLMKKGEDSYVVPQSVRAAAKRGLELRKKQPKSGKAGLDVREASKQGIGSGVARARDLMSGRVSGATVRRMHAYFSRHASNFKLDPGKKPTEDKGYVAGLLWGGAAGKAWAAKTVRQMDAKKKKKSMNFTDLVKGYNYAKKKKGGAVDPGMRAAMKKTGSDMMKKEGDHMKKEGGPMMKKEGNPAGKPAKPPKSLGAIIAAAGPKGFTFDEAVRMYAQAAGIKPRAVNRPSIRNSLNKMMESGKLKTFNRDGETVYVARGK